MSYILEALKKSEQQRKQGRVPDLQTIHLDRPADPHRPAWPYVVIVLLLVSLAFVIGWMQPWKPVSSSVDSSTQSAHTVVQTQSPVAKPATEGDAPANDQPPPVPSQPVPGSAARVEVAETTEPVQKPIEEPPSLDIQAVPHLSEMPTLVKQAIPEMQFAGHVYSSNVEQRSVIINGRSMSEGDVLINDLVVEQITRNGIVFNYRGQLFRMEILQDWSFDY